LLLIPSPKKVIIGRSVKNMDSDKDTVFMSKLNTLLLMHAKYYNKSLQTDIVTMGHFKWVVGFFVATIVGK